MIKKRKKKSKKNQRKRSLESSTDESSQTIQPSTKKRKLLKKGNFITTKKDRSHHAQEEQPKKQTDAKQTQLLGKDLATKTDETNIKRLRNVRLNSEVDFIDIGICKDYQRTGFCGWGDNCIYAHIREQYKSSFDISKDYEESQRRKEMGIDSDSDSDSESEDEDAPTICVICEKEFTEPVVTQCCHYFCTNCIISAFNEEKTKDCPMCGKDTQGILNSAKELVETFKKRKEREKRKKEKKDEDDDDEEPKGRVFKAGWTIKNNTCEIW